MNQQYITPCWQDVAERYAKENDALEQSEGLLEEATSNWRRSAMEASLAQGEIKMLREALKRVREVAAAEINLLRKAARLIHERRKMGSGSVAMFECDAICKKAGLEVWTWPL